MQKKKTTKPEGRVEGKKAEGKKLGKKRRLKGKRKIVKKKRKSSGEIVQES